MSENPESEVVGGLCPMGCGRTLRFEEGEVRCVDPDCPRFSAVMELLADGESEHIVMIGPGGWTIRHPLWERLDDALLSCDLHAHVAKFGILKDRGRYRVSRAGYHNDSWSWRRIK